MAVLKIKVVSIIGRMSELDAVTAACGRSGIFHPDNALSFYSDTSDFSPLNEENPYSEPLQRLTDSVKGIRKEVTILSEKEMKEFSENEDSVRKYVRSISSSLNKLQAERAAAQAKVQEYTGDIEKAGHFVGLDINLDEVHACEYIKARFGCLPKESYDRLNSYNENPYVIFFPSSNDANYYWGVYFAPIEQVTEVDRIFSSLYFERIRLTDMRGTPETAVETMRKMRQEQIKKIADIDDEVEKLWKKEFHHCCEVYSWLTEKSVYFGIRRYVARYNDNFILTGWIPAYSENSFKASLDPIESVEYTFDDAANELMHSPPVKLKNRKPFRPFEFFVDLYGLPAYDEVDPTPFVALTYVILFGIMFGDLGHGLCVALIGYLLWKYKKMPIGRILVPCGISSAVFGTLFGSLFGFEHALDPMYCGIFKLAQKPVDVMNPSTTNLIINLSVGLGVFLVMVAILINIYSCFKRRRLEDALFGPNGIAGFVFYTSLIVGLGIQVITGKKILTAPYVICLIVIPLLAIYFREVLGGLVEHRENPFPEKWGEYIMQNFFEVFEFLLSYASNTISFLRVSAYVLVHAGMMIVVFTLAEMTSGIWFALIVIIGNICVMALEGLLVSIQVLRLEFYEMFSRFFDGDGRPFTPVTVRRELQ